MNELFIPANNLTEASATLRAMINKDMNNYIITHSFERNLHMVLSKIIILLFVLFFTVSPSIAQWKKINLNENKYRAIHWGVDEGLSHDKTYCMLKDVNGFLWIGTEDGLSRFDGSTFKNYYYDPHKRGTISGHRIQGLVEDSLHNIWIGTDKGLSRYDINTDTFTNFLPTVMTDGFSTFIIPFWSTRDEIYCQETDFLITSYNIHSFSKKILIKLTSDDKLGTDYSKQCSIFHSPSNSVWMLESCHNPEHEGGLLRISLGDGKRQHYGWPGYKNIHVRCHWSEGMCYDHKRNSLWLNSNEGLVEFTLDDNQFHHINALDNLVNLKQFANAVGIDVDTLGRVWFGTYPKGIIIYNPADHSVRPLFEEDSLLQHKVSNANGRIYCDRTGMVWSGFWLRKGVYQYTALSHPANRYFTDTIKNDAWKNIIFNCINGDHGRIWMGTEEDGIIVFDPVTNSFQSIRQRDIPGITEKSTVIPVLIDTIGHKALLKVGPPFFLYVMDIDSVKYKPIVFNDTNNHKISVTNIYACSSFKDRCIVNAEYGGLERIFIVNLENGIAHEMLSFPQNSIDGDHTATDGDHFLFLKRSDAINNLTYCFINDKWILTPNRLDSIPWKKIIYNRPDGSYWVIADRQLIHYDKNFQIIRLYNNEDGLPYSEIFVLIPNGKDNIWFNTNRYIYQLNTITGTVTNLSEIEGLQPLDFRDVPQGTGGLKSGNGDLYFPGGGTGQGFVVINPHKYASTSSSVYLKSLEIKQLASSLSTGVNNLTEISLKYFQNRISVETGVIDFYSLGKTHIRYKIEGEERNEYWQNAPGNYSIRYEELPPGNYRLLIQASNAGNAFIGPVKTIYIYISPAFWNTLWFRIIAISFLILLVYALMRWRLKQRFRQQLERSEKERQMAEMKQKASELEMQALRAQMNPHFIFNCLNSINRFILANEATKAADYLTKFAKLIRIVLQQSGRSFIPLEEELSCLQLYMDLESLRFEIPFIYEINPDTIDISAVMVPPLLLQPFVENAIWHGLHPKENGYGRINIDLKQHDEILHCSICDNGIGRKKSIGLVEDNGIGKKSLGIKLTQRRLQLFEYSLKQDEAIIVINDLTNQAGQSAGTCVHIKIPMKLI